MKKIFFLSLILFAFHIFAQSKNKPYPIELNLPPQRSEKFGPFYPMTGPFLWLYADHISLKNKFNNLLNDSKLGPWQTYKTSILKPFNISEGTALTTVDTLTGETRKIIVGSEVKVYLRRNNTEKGSYFNGLFVLLEGNKDDERVLDSIQLWSSEITGFAYSGHEYKFKNNLKFDRPDFKSIPIDKKISSVVEARNSSSVLDFKLKDQKVFNYKNVNFYKLSGRDIHKTPVEGVEDSEAHGYILETSDKKYFDIYPDWGVSQHANEKGHFKISDAIEDADFLIFQPEDGMHKCVDILVFKNNQIKSYSLLCDQGGC